jgi:hypothetical protein
MARTSLEEVEVRLQDGIDRGFYGRECTEDIEVMLRRTTTAIMRLRRFLLDRG